MRFRSDSLSTTRLILVCSLFTALTVTTSVNADESEGDELDRLNFGSDEWVEDEDLIQARQLRDMFQQQARDSGEDNPPYWDDSEAGTPIPADFSPWWQDIVTRPFSEATEPTFESPETLVVRAIRNSSQIRVFSDIPVIRETAELEARGDFDFDLYFDGRLTDLDEPVGSTLKTGGPERFLEDEWLTRLGIRKTFVTGTRIDLSQRWGVLDNNSTYLEPKDQANTRIAFTVTQPLLNGFGVSYNRGVIDVARIDGSVAMDEFKRQVESHLMSVIQAYWVLYQERATLLQRRKLVARGEGVISQMEGRLGLDVGPAQVSRAQAKLSLWESDLTRAETAVRNAETRILSLVNDPALRLSDGFEMIPADPPGLGGSGISTEMAMSLALNNRPEINQSFKQIKAAAVRMRMTRRELLPTLDFFVQFYRDGLAGDSDVDLAYETQWDEGDGSWVAGLVFEYPLGNRAAEARHIRRQAEFRQVNEQLRTTLETVRLELSVSAREVKTARRELDAKYDALLAAEIEVQDVSAREDVEVPEGGVSYLERLLGAFERLTRAEHEFLTSQVVYNVALLNLDRATGTLLQTYQLEPNRYESDDGLPAYRLQQAAQ